MDRKVELMKKLIDLYEQRSFVGSFYEVPCTRMIIDDHIKQMEKQLCNELSEPVSCVDLKAKTKEESYKYFVSFYYVLHNRMCSYGNMMINTDEPISSLNTKNVELAIKKDLNALYVALINIIEQ